MSPSTIVALNSSSSSQTAHKPGWCIVDKSSNTLADPPLPMNSQFEENPWDPPTLTEPTRQQHTLPCLQQSLNRAARRVRAANDPLVSPSRAHINEFETATRKRALKGMLECIDDAISTPMPHSDIRMARVRADVDVTVMGSPVLNGTGLAISLPEDGGVLPLRIPEVPGRQSVDSMSEVSYAKGALSVSEGSTVGHVLMAGQNSRTIKTVKHSVTGEDTLEGISILYGVSVSNLKRLNRLWSPSELLIRDYLYIPLRVCSEKYTLEYIDYVNSRHRDELLRGLVPTIRQVHLIEVVLDSEEEADSNMSPWPRISYKSIQKCVSFVF